MSEKGAGSADIKADVNVETERADSEEIGGDATEADKAYEVDATIKSWF